MNDQGVTVRLFIGYHINSEMKIILSKSFLWKQVVILPSNLEENLIEVSHEGKIYLGSYLKEGSSLDDIRQVEKHIIQKMKSYCVDFPLDHLLISIFPQVFIA